MKSINRAAVAQWTKRLTRNGQTRVRIREAHIFDITLASRLGSEPRQENPNGFPFISITVIYHESGANVVNSKIRCL